MFPNSPALCRALAAHDLIFSIPHIQFSVSVSARKILHLFLEGRFQSVLAGPACQHHCLKEMI